MRTKFYRKSNLHKSIEIHIYNILRIFLNEFLFLFIVLLCMNYMLSFVPIVESKIYV